LSISTIIPTYNRRSRLFQAVDSVLAQTVASDEIIVVDDGSTDGTVEAIRARYGSDVRILRQENAGASAARNHGTREARSEWIAFLDSDDVWFPKKIECQMEALSTADDVGVCFTNNIFNGNPDMKLSVFATSGFVPASRIGILDDPAKYILAGLEPFYTSSFLIKRSLLTELGGLDESLVVREDTDLFFRLGFRAKFCFVREALVSIDRTPGREVGLCNLYATRDDRKYDSLNRLYSKWLAMPEVAATTYEAPVRELKRLTLYNSIEAKLHQVRIGPALRDIRRLRKIEAGYSLIARTLLSRRIGKQWPTNR
jgi:glycosyltransferase involved in cell wall biosynthesis